MRPVANPSWGNSTLAAIANNTLLANISGGSLAPSATTLTALIDAAIGSTQGDILYRNSTGWVVLAPGTTGFFLQTQGASANPQWAAGNSGTVTNVATGTGLTGGPITSTGTISLAAIANDTLLANISGSSAVPSSTTLTALIDAALGNTQGDVLYRNGTVWTVLPPGTSGFFLQTQGASANPQWAAGNAGTVTSLATNNGITGGTITSTGTLGLAPIINNTLLANISGGTLYPSSTTLTALIDAALGNTQGDVLYRNGTVWTVLPPGTAGYLLATGGAAANPSWVAPGGTGTVTSVATNNGLTGGTITSTGTLGLAPIADDTFLANTSGGTLYPVATTLSAFIDSAIGSAQGDILFRGSALWSVLAPGTAGYLLQTGGAAANPSWVAPPVSAVQDYTTTFLFMGG